MSYFLYYNIWPSPNLVNSQIFPLYKKKMENELRDIRSDNSKIHDRLGGNGLNNNTTCKSKNKMNQVSGRISIPCCDA